MCNSLRYWTVFVLLGTVLPACGSNLVLPDDNSPAALRVVDGDDQEGTVGSLLAPLVVQVTDANSQPLEGVRVEFVPDTDAAEVQVTPEAFTDNNGVAAAEVRLGMEAGPLVVRAQVSEALRTSFDLTALAEEDGKKGRGKGRDRGDDEDDDDEDDD